MPGVQRRRSAPPSTRPANRSSTPSGAHRYWGWHRLHAEPAADIVARAGIRPGDLVLDLGAGDGALTAPLAAAGARVLAIELHPARAERLRTRFADQPSVTVVQRDLLDLRLPQRRFRVVANPPWSLAKTLIRMLTGPHSSLIDAHLLLQRGLVADLGRRGVAGPGARQRYRAEYAQGLSRSALQPPPPGAAAWLRLVRTR